MGLVQAMTMLYQRQRSGGEDLQHGTEVEATPEDYAIVRRLLVGPMGRALGGGLSGHVMAVGQWLLDILQEGEEVTTVQLLGRDGCRWGESALYNHVRTLKNAGVLAKAGVEGNASLYRIAGPLPGAGPTWLPTPQALGMVP